MASSVTSLPRTRFSLQTNVGFEETSNEFMSSGRKHSIDHDVKLPLKITKASSLVSSSHQPRHNPSCRPILLLAHGNSTSIPTYPSIPGNAFSESGTKSQAILSTHLNTSENPVTSTTSARDIPKRTYLSPQYDLPGHESEHKKLAISAISQSKSPSNYINFNPKNLVDELNFDSDLSNVNRTVVANSSPPQRSEANLLSAISFSARSSFLSSCDKTACLPDSTSSSHT
ncbi:unnamed protein product [Protopolystoma xenopodis]|uniref:Uncharacterized protein n=1 Tax=Protopolystoma xenopodis TaxID=117903 RepID=A0A448WDV1_9PLAT|nr:unnamed protein product [Protopolystoma xenopodis]